MPKHIVTSDAAGAPHLAKANDLGRKAFKCPLFCLEKALSWGLGVDLQK